MTTATAAATELRTIALDDLHPAEDNPRGPVGTDLTGLADLEDLAATIKDAGILEPLVVVPRDGLPGYTIVAGHRRRAAAEIAGLTEVPCVVRHDMDNTARRLAMLVENLQRVDLSPVAEARGYRDAQASGLSQRDIADKVGRNQSHISKRLKLLALPDDVLAKVDAGSISVEVGGQLAVLAKAAPERLAKVTAGDSINDWEVRREVEQLQAELRQTKKRGELEAAGVTVLDREEVGYWSGDGKTAIQLSGIRHEREIDEAAHADLPCHAVTFDRYRIDDTVAVCTKPTSHPKKKRPAGSKETAEDRAERESRERARDARHALCRQLIEQIDADELDLEDPALLEHVLCQLIDAAMETCDARDIRTWLDLPRPDTTYAEWQGEDIKAYATTPPAGRRLIRTAVAVALSLGDWGMHPVKDLDGAARHLAFLQAHGYQPTGEESDVYVTEVQP